MFIKSSAGPRKILFGLLTTKYKLLLYKLKICSNKECCKQSRYVKFKGTLTKWPVQKLTHRTTQKHRHLEKKMCFLYDLLLKYDTFEVT